MVKHFTERRTRSGSPCLFPINPVQRVSHKVSESGIKPNPPGDGINPTAQRQLRIHHCQHDRLGDQK